MMKVTCIVCGVRVEAARARRKFCGQRCYMRAYRAAKRAEARPVEPAPPHRPWTTRATAESAAASSADEALVASVRSELARLAVLESSLGQQTVVVAAALGRALSGHASISRELSRLRAEARAMGAERRTSVFDEIAARRVERRA